MHTAPRLSPTRTPASRSALAGSGAVTSIAPATVKARSLIHAAGALGGPGRLACLVRGVVALKLPEQQQLWFAGLALPGDLVGAESLYQGRFAFSAHALTPCVLRPWPEPGTPLSHGAVARLLVASQQRMAELIALRRGPAQARVCRLILLLSQGGADDDLVLPTLQDMAAMIDLAMESICREMTRLRADQVLVPAGKRHHFRLNRPAMLARLTS